MTHYEVDQFIPDYQTECDICGSKPCVSGVIFVGQGKRKVRTLYRSSLCGPCTFGTQEAIDPETWNPEEQ